MVNYKIIFSVKKIYAIWDMGEKANIFCATAVVDVLIGNF